jgi:hypothetical protein
MRSIIKKTGIAARAAVIVFLMAACRDTVDNGNNGNNGPTHYTGTLRMGGQVWVQNRETNRINDMTYLKYPGGDMVIQVFPAFSYNSEGKISESWEQAGSGTIKNGFLNFTIDELADGMLINSDNLKELFSEWDNVQIEPSTVKGNIIYPETTDGGRLNREGLTGTRSSISLESILYIYISGDCQITGSPGGKKNRDDHFSITDSDLNLSLKKGWNTVCRKQTYTANSDTEEYGYEKETIEIKNPNDFKWVLHLSS